LSCAAAPRITTWRIFLRRKAIRSSGVRHGTPRVTNLASDHYDPSRFLIELYSDMDVLVPELNIFEPRALA